MLVEVRRSHRICALMTDVDMKHTAIDERYRDVVVFGCSESIQY